MYWYIWSIEHDAWWRQGSQGYTKLKELAGMYTTDEAVATCQDANAHCDVDRPNEAMVPCE